MKLRKVWLLAAFAFCLIALPAAAAQAPAKGTPEWAPKAGERWLEVIKKDRKLHLRQGETILKTYRVAIGSGKGTKKSPIDKITPEGVFTIRRIADPTDWVFDPKVFNEPGEPQKDVYGTRAISFRNPWNLAIHGTNAPWSIGKAVTHGCIRLKNSDIEELVKHVKPGMKLVIREKPLSSDSRIVTSSAAAKPLPAQKAVSPAAQKQAGSALSPVVPQPVSSAGTVSVDIEPSGPSPESSDAAQGETSEPQV